MYFSLPDEFLYPVVKKDDLDIEEDLVRGTDIEPISEEAEEVKEVKEVKEIEEREDNSSSESFEDIDEEYASSEEGSTRGEDIVEDIVEEVGRTEVPEEQEVVEVVGEVQQASIEENIDEEE